MMVFRQIASEIYSMFAGDVVMTIFTVAIVLVAAVLRYLTPIPTVLIGFGVLAGCLTLLIGRVASYATSARQTASRE